MESLNSVKQSNLNNRPLYYSRDSYRTNQHSRSDISMDAKLTGKSLFAAWVITNPAYTEEKSKITVTVIGYTNMDLSPQDVPESLELITGICYCLHNKRHMKRAELYPETPYDTICVLEVWEYLQLLSEGGLKEELATKPATCYIRVIKN